MSTSRHASLIGLATLALIAFAAPARADTVVFSDDFDAGDPATPGALNTAPPGWTATVGTVDFLHGTGSASDGNAARWGIACHSGTGCVDLDGSSNAAGRIVSNALLSLTAGTQYALSAFVSGNQRGGATDTMIFGIQDLADNNVVAATTNPIAFDAPFAQVSTGLFSVLTSGSYRVFFQGTGGDNVGAILDDVALTAVPLPASAWLLLSGIVGLALISRRRHDGVSLLAR